MKGNGLFGGQVENADKLGVENGRMTYLLNFSAEPACIRAQMDRFK